MKLEKMTPLMMKTHKALQTTLDRIL